MEKELEQCKKRLLELAEKCYLQNVYCFTGFLGMAELDVFYSIQRELSHVPVTAFGGNEGCERQMLRFGSLEQLGYEEAFPIVCLEIRPRMEKFAQELTHRDFLGACMNLGIERSTIGDILCRGKSAYLYCTEKIAPYIVENLHRIRHTEVLTEVFSGELKALAPQKEERVCQVSSERLDAVIAKTYNLSREKSLLLFREKKIFVNGRTQENNSAAPKPGDIVSVRGYGKFCYLGMESMTRKGKYSVRVAVYV